MDKRYLFVGEKPSRTAFENGWTWESGRLAAATLFAALEPLGIDPRDRVQVQFVNLFGDRPDDPNVARKSRLDVVRAAMAEGRQVVALGSRVGKALSSFGLEHITVVHPAARGAIRNRSNYRWHIEAKLAPAN